MFDFDIKDDIEKDSSISEPIKIKNNLINNINKIKTLVQIFYNNFGIILKFIFLSTDRGYHFFLLNKTGYNKNLFLMEIMTNICNDSWYSAFSYSNSWAIRLNKKESKDYIAELSFNETFKNCLNNEDNIPEDSFDTDNLTRELSFKSKVYNKEIKIKYPDIKDKSLIIIEPDQNQEYIPQLKIINAQHERTLSKIKNIDNTNYIFNKICYHYCLIQYFKEFDSSYIRNLECNIGEIILDLNDNNMIKNLRDDLEIISNSFGISKIDQSIINDFAFPNYKIINV